MFAILHTFSSSAIFLLTTNNPSYILFIGYKVLVIDNYRIFQSTAVLKQAQSPIGNIGLYNERG